MIKQFILSAGAVCAMAAGPVFAADVAYLSSGGWALGGSGGATLVAWTGQKPLSFSGYGQIVSNGKCLTGPNGGQQLTWETCKTGRVPAQIWGGLDKGRLNNEVGWCADVEGGRYALGTRVVAWQCGGASNQRWNPHYAQPAATLVQQKVSNAAARPVAIKSATDGLVGQLIDTKTGQLVAAGGGNLNVPTGGPYLIITSKGNLVAAGGGN